MLLFFVRMRSDTQSCHSPAYSCSSNASVPRVTSGDWMLLWQLGLECACRCRYSTVIEESWSNKLHWMSNVCVRCRFLRLKRISRFEHRLEQAFSWFWQRSRIYVTYFFDKRDNGLLHLGTVRKTTTWYVHEPRYIALHSFFFAIYTCVPCLCIL